MTGTEVAVTARQADQKHCFSCGKLIHMSAGSCPFCGAGQHGTSAVSQSGPGTLPDGQRVFCRGCGTPVHVEATACPKCGAPQPGTKNKQAPNRVTAAILALFLGGLGFHRFYLNQPLWGLAYLILCWTFVPAVFAFFEGLYFLFESDEKFARIHGGQQK